MAPHTSRLRRVTRAAGALVLASVLLLDVPAPPAHGDPRTEDVTVVWVDSRDGRPDVRTIDLPDRAAARASVARLRTRGFTAELDARVSALGHADGGDLLRDQQWALDRLYGEGAHTTRHASTQLIAVIDTGVDALHPDLLDRVVPGADFVTPGTQGLIDPPGPAGGHGTAVASIVAATTGDGLGMAGTEPNASVLPVRVLDERGEGHTSAVAQGIVYAVDAGATVLNLSLGSTQRSAAVADAVRYAESRGVVVVAAAGNLGTTEPMYPAAEHTVLAVAATTPRDQRAAFSSHGGWLDLTAPGVRILVARANTTGHTLLDGTSFAAPHVSGVAALSRELTPGYRPGQIRARLTYNAHDLAPVGFDVDHGSGLVAPTRTLFRSDGFPDSKGNTHEANIRSLVETRITNGCQYGTNYCPDDPVTRAQMASFLRRVTQLAPVGGTSPFTDTVTASTHGRDINAIAHAGITEGCGNGRFCPDRDVTRAEMAAFIQRALGLPDAREGFEDVPNGAWYAPAVGALYAAGITQGCKPTKFCADRAVTRAEMASFLARGWGL